MKFLLFLSTLELGGAERQAVNLAKYLKSNGMEVQILGLGSPGKVKTICEATGIPCDSMSSGNFVYSMIMKIGYRLRVFNISREEKDLMPLVRRLVAYLKDGKYDVCISYCRTANTILGIAKILYSKPLCMWFQRDAGIYDNKDGLQQKAIEAVDYVLANGSSGKEWIREAYGKEAIIIYNGVELDLPKKSCEEWQKSLGISENDIVCTMIANLSHAKDHMFLLETWRELIRRENTNLKLVFAGRFDDKYEELNNFVHDNNLDDYVFFLGQVDDISGLLSATDICVFSAKSEGSPNGVIEPAIMGLPVVATDLPEIREILSEENYLLLFDKNNIDKAINSLINLAQDKQLRTSIGIRNKEKTEKLFSTETNFGKIQQMVADGLKLK